MAGSFNTDAANNANNDYIIVNGEISGAVENSNTGNSANQLEDSFQDPLDISSLSLNFNNLLNNLNLQTCKLALELNEKILSIKLKSDSNIYKINENILNFKKILAFLNTLNSEIDKLQQLQFFTADFLTRLSNIQNQIDSIK